MSLVLYVFVFEFLKPIFSTVWILGNSFVCVAAVNSASTTW